MQATRFLSILAVLGSFFLSACADLGAVRDWASVSMEAAQFNQVVTTYADTPHRLLRYDKAKNVPWRQEAEERKAQAVALREQLTLVADYMAALKALSSDAAADYGKDVDVLSAALKSTGQIKETTLTASTNLMKVLLNAAAKSWQKRQVALLIGEANQPLQTILAGELRSIVAQDFQRDLKIEEQFLNRYFEDLIRFGGGSKPAQAGLSEWFDLRLAENNRRRLAAEAYLVTLDKIAVGHQKLYDGRNDIDAAALVKELYSLAKEIKDSISKLSNG